MYGVWKRVITRARTSGLGLQGLPGRGRAQADTLRAMRKETMATMQDGRVVFYIAGNKYRIVVWFNYPYRVVYIRFIGTHRQYDAIDAQSI